MLGLLTVGMLHNLEEDNILITVVFLLLCTNTYTCTHTHTLHTLHSSAGAPQLPRINSEASLDADTSLTSDGAAGLGGVPPTALEQTMMEMDRLGVEETRDLVVSVLFVLKHLDRSK